MKQQKILTLHPQGKSGKNIDKQKYNQIKTLIIKHLKTKQLTFTQLLTKIAKQLKGKFQGAIPWYLETVKLDLEARKIIKRIPKTSPQLYKLNK